jgi:hypothetical protein
VGVGVGVDLVVDGDGDQVVAEQKQFVVRSCMATPQDPPTRKKQKARASRKLAEWRKKQDAKKTTASATSAKK